MESYVEKGLLKC